MYRLKVLCIFLYCAFWFSLTGFSAWAHGTSYEVLSHGLLGIKASFDTGEALADAKVLVFAPGETKVTFESKTDPNGIFAFYPDRPGLWILQIRDPGGHGIRVNLDVKPGQVVTKEQNPPTGQLTWIQKTIIALAVSWGFIGTALFFRSKSLLRRKADSEAITKKTVRGEK